MTLTLPSAGTDELTKHGLIVDEVQHLDGMLSTAVLDTARTRRYLLSRCWRTGPGPFLVYVMLNPSTADAHRDDATLLRCAGFARRESATGFAVVNLFSHRSTDPAGLRTVTDPVGPHNNSFLHHTTALPGATVIAAWGEHGILHGRAAEVTTALARRGITLHCLAVNSSGQPGHPLRLPASAPLVSYRPPLA